MTSKFVNLMEEKNSTLFFDNFQKTTKEEWQNKVEKDRKGSPLEDLFWNIEKDLSAEPFYHADDFDKFTNPISRNRGGSNWKLGQSIQVDDLNLANTQALEALEGGADVLEFLLPRTLKLKEFKQLFKNIELSFISTHFHFKNNKIPPLPFFEEYLLFLGYTENKRAEIKGAFTFDDSTCPTVDIKSMLTNCVNHINGFKIFTIETSESNFVTEDLSRLIFKANELLIRLKKEGISPDLIAKHIQFSVFVGKNYFVEIAKLRALKLLWANVLKAHKCDWEVPAKVSVRFSPSALDEDENQNMISAATMALSAIIGGADVLFTGKADKDTTSFNRRISRNVQHVLKMESFMDKVADPAAGSYYIEKLTEKIAEESWKAFQEKI